MPQVFGNAVGDVSFEAVPDKFIGVKLRRIAGEVKGLDSSKSSKESFDDLGSVERTPVPKKDNPSLEVPKEMPEELDNLSSPDVLVGMEAGVKSEALLFGRDADSGNGRDFSPATCNGKFRSSALRRPRFPEVGNQRESAFVEENQAGPKPSGLFLYGARRVVSNTGFPPPVFLWLAWSAPDSSSPNRPSDTKDSKDNNRLGISCERLGRYALGSRRPSNNRLPGALSPKYAPKPSSVCRKDARAFRDGVSVLGPSIPSCDRLAATAPGNSSKPPLSGPRLRRYGLVSKAGRPCAAGFPTVGVCHEVSLFPPGLPLYDRPEILSIER